MVESIKNRIIPYLSPEAREDAQRVGIKIFLDCMKLLDGKDSLFLESKKNKKNCISIEILGKKSIEKNYHFKNDKTINLVIMSLDNKEKSKGYFNKVTTFIFYSTFYDEGYITKQTIAFRPYRVVVEEEMGKVELDELAEEIKGSDQYKKLIKRKAFKFG